MNKDGGYQPKTGPGGGTPESSPKPELREAVVAGLLCLAVLVGIILGVSFDLWMAMFRVAICP